MTATVVPVRHDDGQFYIPSDYCIPMSTVITWFRTVEGFVIGSDGRNSDAETHQVITDDAQKIFPVERPHVRLAYALAHTIRLGRAADQVMFDFPTEVPRAFEVLSARRRTDWQLYLRALAKTLSERLNASRNSSGLTLDKPTETYIFLGGYFEKRVKVGHIHFRHGAVSSEAEPYVHPPEFNAPPFGSEAVFDLISKGDSRFSQYSEPKRKNVFTLSEAISRAEKDIRAHCDLEALKLDPDRCRGIGGRVQIATVTFTHGFRWVRGFEPVSGG
jgi:hypothetical protein